MQGQVEYQTNIADSGMGHRRARVMMKLSSSKLDTQTNVYSLE